MRDALLLLVLALASFAPFYAYPEWRGTEARRVEVANSMAQSGDYLVPRLWNEETFAKPPFYYWILSTLIRLGGQEPWLMRLPSLLGFWLLAFMALRYLREWHDATTGWVGAVGILVSPLVMYDAPFAEIDPVFAVLTALSLFCLSDGVFQQRRGALVIAGVLGGLAVMTKGPPYLMFFVGPIYLWFRHSRMRGILWYLPFVFGFYLVYKLVLDQAGPSVAAGAVAVDETVGRLAFWNTEALAGIPTHFLNCLVVIGLPLSFWLVPWFRGARKSRDDATERSRFLLWGAFGAFLVLTFSTGRASRYLLPAVPMVICGLAPLVANSLQSGGAPTRNTRRALLGFGTLMAIAAVALPWVKYPYPGTTGIALLALVSVGWFVHSQRRLVQFALALPLIVGWAAFPDRIEYHRCAADFAPHSAAVLGRELQRRGVAVAGSYGPVNTSVLLHARESMGSPLEVYADSQRRHSPVRPWLLVMDRGAARKSAGGGVELVAGYRDVLRVQTDKNKSISLRAKQ
ncbi:MAG: glycosyltransferase family 39 protein, partial [Planctomycetota bacterium]|nr:glycosyltransferase family 39 protein [Planctomycetota bacterium]